MRKSDDLDGALIRARDGKFLSRSEVKRMQRLGLLKVQGCDQSMSLTKAGLRRAETVGAAR